MPPEEVSHASEKEAVDVIFGSDISTLEKVYALDTIYNCNLKLSENRYRSLSKALRGINKRIREVGDYNTADSIVDEIARWKYNPHRRIGNVFASKYCYFTKQQPEGLFVIYDKYADIALVYLETNHAAQQYWGNYKGYASKVRELLQQLEGKGLRYRDIDKYLWLFGQVLYAVDKHRDIPTRIASLGNNKLMQLKQDLDPI